MARRETLLVEFVSQLIVTLECLLSNKDYTRSASNYFLY